MNETVDTETPSIARVYDAFLDGKDNFAVDRALRDDVLRVAPETRLVAVALRAWLVRVVRYLVQQQGVRQFVDVGSGLPTQENTHEVAQRYAPESSVVYVDNDPAVAAYGRALLEDNDRTHFAVADLTRPQEVLAHPEVREQLERDEPVAMIQCATMHHVSDALHPPALMADYVAALPPGSYVALTHWWDPEDDAEGTSLARRIESIYQDSAMVSAARYRTRAEIEALFPGLKLLEPGVVPLHEWWPGGPQIETPPLVTRLVLGGVGRKP